MKTEQLLKNSCYGIRILVVMIMILSQFGSISSQVSARPSDSHVPSGPANVGPTISGNAGIAGATITYTGGATSADARGDYSFEVVLGWTGTVTPSLAGHTFYPAYRAYLNVQYNWSAQNYTACASTCILNTLTLIIR